MNDIELNRLEMDGLAGRPLELFNDLRKITLQMTRGGALTVRFVLRSGKRGPAGETTAVFTIENRAREQSIEFLEAKDVGLHVGHTIFELEPDERLRARAWLSGALRPTVPDSSAFQSADVGADPARS